MRIDEIVDRLKSMSDPECVQDMARFGINAHNTCGIPMTELVKIAREIGKDHALAGELWASGIHEAKMIACLVEDPELVDEPQVEHWVRDLDSWDICDECCLKLFDKLPVAYEKAVEWSRRKEEFVRRAGFVLMAVLAIHDKEAADSKFTAFLPLLKEGSLDERNYVKKAVNWALRQIGKRNLALNEVAIKTAREIQQIDSRSARWVAADAIRELTGEEVQRRVNKAASIATPLSKSC